MLVCQRELRKANRDNEKYMIVYVKNSLTRLSKSINRVSCEYTCELKLNTLLKSALKRTMLFQSSSVRSSVGIYAYVPAKMPD